MPDLLDDAKDARVCDEESTRARHIDEDDAPRKRALAREL